MHVNRASLYLRFHQQVILNNYRTIDKPFIYRFLHPWLGTGLLTASGNVLLKLEISTLGIAAAQHRLSNTRCALNAYSCPPLHSLAALNVLNVLIRRDRSFTPSPTNNRHNNESCNFLYMQCITAQILKLKCYQDSQNTHDTLKRLLVRSEPTP